MRERPKKKGKEKQQKGKSEKGGMKKASN